MAVRECGRTFVSWQQDIRTISAALLNSRTASAEWTPLFYEDHPAREFCVQYGESDGWRFCPGCVGGGGLFFFERFAADSPEQKLTLCDDVAG